MEEDETSQNIVMDPGSYMFKAGFAGDEVPSVLFPSVLGSRRFLKNEKLRSDEFIGYPAQEMTDMLSLRYPIKSGIVTNWDDMEKLMEYSYKQLDAKSDEHPVVLAQPPLTSSSHKEKFAQLMFETFHVPAFHMLDSSLLCSLCAGRSSGVMIDIGDGVAFAVPLYESHCMTHGIQRQDFAGQDLTYYLRKQLQVKGHSFVTTSDFEIVRDIKERLCYTALDYDMETIKAKSSQDLKSSYTLNDGTKITLNNERFDCAEVLFQPSLFGFHGMEGIQNMVYNAIQSCEFDTRGDIMCNLMVSGRSIRFSGFIERLKKEMKLLIAPTMRINVLSSCDAPELTVWIGGSIQASLSVFQNCFVSKQRYEEDGPSIFHHS